MLGQTVQGSVLFYLEAAIYLFKIFHDDANTDFFFLFVSRVYNTYILFDGLAPGVAIFRGGSKYSHTCMYGRTDWTIL